VDSDLSLDQHAIQHLLGDIAEDVLGVKGTPWSDFKPVQGNLNQVQPKRIEVKRN
jgi:hypothetical protein